MSSQSEVRRLVDQALQNLPRIDVLVNNVGGYWNTRHVTADGFELTFALNHLAAFLVTNLLLDRLTKSSPARVVTVSSHAHAAGRIDFADLQSEASYSGARAYNQSKLANIMFTPELARRLRGSGVTATVLHPGVVRTGFGAEDPTGIQRLLVPFAKPFMKSPDEGAATAIYLASASGLDHLSGQYFVNGKPKRSSKRSYDERRRPTLAGQRRPGRPIGTGLTLRGRAGEPETVFIARQVSIKHKYGLWATRAEQAAMIHVLNSCPGQPLITAAESAVPPVQS